MTNHYTAAEHIAAQQSRIDALTAENLRLRQQNAILIALLVNLPTANIVPGEMARAIIANCPRWRSVAMQLVFHAMEESNNDLE